MLLAPLLTLVFATVAQTDAAETRADKSSDLTQSQVDSIVSAAKDCAAATGREGVSLSVLRERGWKPVPRIVKDGEPDEDKSPSVNAYSKGGDNPGMIIQNGKANCTLIGVLPGEAAFESIQSGLRSAFGPARASNDQGSMYSMFPDLITLARKDTQGGSAFLILVSEPGE
jgi:hypothetical protein